MRKKLRFKKHGRPYGWLGKLVKMNCSMLLVMVFPEVNAANSIISNTLRDLTLGLTTEAETHKLPISNSYEKDLSIKQKGVTGTVIDQEGVPIAGISVQAKGASTITTTDQNGEFALVLPQEATHLVFSSVGFISQEIPIANQQHFNVVLETSVNDLDEVVIVGYGTQKKINLTGAVSQISGDDIMRTSTNNLTNTLSGRLSGVSSINGNGRPGSGSSIQVRGLSTMNDNSPLVVVDGMVRTDGFGNIDPNEVESITVLKDASSAAVYGARASNGVILVTTKKGVQGKPTITYSGLIGTQSPTQYPRLMSAYEYAAMRNGALLNQGYDPTNPSHTSLFYSDDDLERFRQGGTDWYQETFKNNSLQQNHNVSMSGGGEAMRFFVSLGTLGQDGMYDNINFKRYNVRTNLDAKITDNLNVGLYIDGRQESHKAPGWDANDIFHRVINVSPTRLAYHDSGRPANTTGSHPVEMIRSSGYTRDQNTIFSGSLSAEQKLPFIVEGLSFKANASYFKSNQFLKSFITPYTMYDEDGQGNVVEEKMVGGRTALRELYQEIINTSYNLSLNYQNSFGRHDLSGLVLFEEFGSKGNTFNARKEDFSTDLKDEFFASGPNNQTIGGNSILNDARRSLVGRVNYAFDSKYLFEATFRYDGSFRFPKDRRFGLFPAASVGWNISQEEFFRNSGISKSINHLKLRLSKGIIGNDRVNPFQFMESFSLISGQGPIIGGQPVSSAVYGRIPNPYITWEKQDNNNIGVEFATLNSRLNVEVDYFVRVTKDILWSRERLVPGTFGRVLPDENYARVRSNGIDLSIGFQDKVNDFDYSVKLIGNYAKNKVTEIDDPSNALDFERQLGKSIGFIPGYKSDGIFQSEAEAAAWGNGYQFGQQNMPGDIRYVDIDGDGEITNEDQQVISEYGSMPRIMYGINASMSYKNFDFHILFQGAAQRSVMLSSAGRVMFLNGGSSNNFAYLTDSWTENNPNAAYPRAWIDSRSINDRNSDFWLRKADFLRLKSVDIGYRFNDSKWLKERGLGSTRIYLSGYNLLTFSSFKEFDPEAESGAGNYYPQQRTFNLGINLSF